ncbi:MAG TPA: energy transducer TonB [Gemmatimonadaceae bacterium]|nr:energy transducer TonB [Gemmatimonadaceae bacterium]
MRAHLRIVTGFALVVVAGLVATPASAFAQARVYSPAELSVMPKVASPAAAARAVHEAHPDALRKAGVGGVVECEFVVGPDGKVEDSSIEIIAASPPALGSAAKAALTQIQFRPGKVNGQAVRVKVALPLEFKAS